MYLDINNLVKFYKKGSPLIKKLNFSVKKGEIISFIGESGSGKTTLLKCIAGLEKINDGQIILNSLVLNDDRVFIKPQKRKIGFIFQDYPLFPHLSLIDNITFNLDKSFLKNLPYMLNLTGLENLVSRFPHQLSGGEQQRACIARSLIREPDLLLMDEPFSNLDSSIKGSMIDEIYKILKQTKTTTILVTHDINDSLNISDRILVFKAGVLQQYADPVKIYCEPVNCYCAKVLGGLNKIFVNGKVSYIRPENIRVVKKSSFKVLVEKCYFQGRDFKVKGSIENEPCFFTSKNPLKINSFINIDFDSNDLMFFDSLCESFFQ
ncbi:MAG: ABC transporter ATP-binding protein [Flavobacteriaceae bacterium TMED121]|nr:MAG: ABC transporter ATP-binding protein [Flavobacteriaceae bacterium TMED121]